MKATLIRAFVIFHKRACQGQVRAWIIGRGLYQVPSGGNLFTKSVLTAALSSTPSATNWNRMKIELTDLVPKSLFRAAERKTIAALDAMSYLIDVEVLGCVATRAEHLLRDVTFNGMPGKAWLESRIALPPFVLPTVRAGPGVPDQRHIAIQGMLQEAPLVSSLPLLCFACSRSTFGRSLVASH